MNFVTILLKNGYKSLQDTTIEMRPIDVKDNTYINIDKEINDEKPKFKVGDHVRISTHKDIVAIDYTPNWSK